MRTLHIDVELTQSSQVLDVGFDEGQNLLDIELVGGGSGRFPYYRGSYDITPTKTERVIECEDKSMKDDLVIHPIYFAETINTGGGYTAIIGSE